jgi:hypothetical protein
MQAKNIILIAMLTCYLIPIITIANIYAQNNSVSHTISIVVKKDPRYLLYPMITMCVLSVLYEYLDFDFVPFFSILSLVIGIMGIIFVDESKWLHYFFATLCFLGIASYCIHSAFLHPIPYLFSLVVLIASFSLVYNMQMRHSIFWEEIIVLLFFALVYLYKHFFLRQEKLPK